MLSLLLSGFLIEVQPKATPIDRLDIFIICIIRSLKCNTFECSDGSKFNFHLFKGKTDVFNYQHIKMVSVCLKFNIP